MIEHQGVWLPDGEQHLQGWMTTYGELVDGKGSYQIKKLRRAVSYCKSFRTAVDVGAHVGLWSMQLVKRFALVHAFEPVADHRACFELNVSTASNSVLYACALGAQAGSVAMHLTPGSSGDTYVEGEGDIPLRTLDSFNLMDVDFIKLDCEGFEHECLVGGRETIARDRPVIIVEQKPGKAQKFGLGETDAVEYLKTLGYAQALEMGGDFVMVPTT